MIWIVALGIAAGCALAYARGDRGVALGGMLVAAAFSGVTARIGAAGVRLEQPAIVILALLIAAREPRLTVASVRRAWLPAAFLLIYLGANIASALLFSPDVLQSLKVTLWLAISITGGVIAMVLVVRPGGRTVATIHIWIVGAAIANTSVAVMQVAAEILLKSTWGVLQFDAPLGKASGLAWEPNLLSIYLAMAMAFLLFPPSRMRLGPRWRWGWIIFLAFGMALSLSRGGLVALAIGLIVGVAFVAPTPTRRIDLPQAILPGLVALAIASCGYAALGWLGGRGVGLQPAQHVGADEGPLPPLEAATPVPAAGSSGAQLTAPPSEPPSVPSPGTGISDDTIGLRVRNLVTAWEDGLKSPILGNGPDTFGQRYVEPSCDCPAHIPNQISATFYETGFVGLVSLLAAFCLVVIGSVRAGRPELAVALTVLIVGYQFTDAIRFATLWLVMGVAVGAALSRDSPDGRSSQAAQA